MNFFSELDLSLFGRKKVQVVLQSEMAECGLACLTMIAGFHGHETDLPYLRREWSVSAKGVTLSRLTEMSKLLSLTPRALRLEPDAFHQLSRPCILHWNMDHFVVLEAVKQRGIVIVDPAVGRRFVTGKEAARHFTGVALELIPAAGFEKRKYQSKFKLWHLLQGTAGLYGALGQLMLFSLALQVFTLAMPFYSQLIIDEVVISKDLGLLNLLFVAFSILTVVRITINALRSWVIVYLGMKIRLSWAARLFFHLIRLPMSYFSSRHLGDIQSRYGSLTALQELVTTKFVEAIVDGLMACTTFTVLFLYDARLAAVVLLSVLLYLAVKMLLLPNLRLRSREAIVAAARKDSYFLETIRGVMAIKNFAMEHRREADYQSTVVRTINMDTQVYRIGIVEVTFGQFIFSMQFLIVVWLAAQSIVVGEFTVGMMVAFLAYRAQFTERSAQLVDKAIEFKLARIHLDRLSDIVETNIEPGLLPSDRSPDSDGASIRTIEVRDAWFQYSASDPYVIQDVSLQVAAREFVAITGASGFGKTTLLKLLMGLYTPSRGQVLVDGQPLDKYGVQNYRNKFAAVMQDDALLAGTLADNISFFDPAVDMARVTGCAALAAIDEDIRKMPMQYFTLVGDMGAALSGGQKQRVMLARALYKQPDILFLDEASSHLDADTERRIIANLKQLPITIVSVAHREESIKQADRLFRMGDLKERLDHLS